MESDIDIRIKNFKEFHHYLTENAPEGYNPWFFPCAVRNKNPDPKAIIKRAPPKCPECNQEWKYDEKQKKILCPKCKKAKGSWHQPYARLNKKDAVTLIKEGYNIGISARKGDPLCIIDIDSEKYLDQISKDTLVVRSRKRAGMHAFHWASDDSVKINLPTDEGEIRSSDQYVLAAGSFVPFTDNDLQSCIKNDEISKNTAELVKNDEFKGFYTLESHNVPTKISFDQLPPLFKKKHQENIESTVKIKTYDKKEFSYTNGSALFDLNISNIVEVLPKTRVSHPLHESDTNSNFSINDEGTLCHCWRHLVSLNPIQFLCVMSGYAKCEDAGTPHKKRGESKIKGDRKAVIAAWKQAKKMGIIPKDDPKPFKKKIKITYRNAYVKRAAFKILDVKNCSPSDYDLIENTEISEKEYLKNLQLNFSLTDNQINEIKTIATKERQNEDKSGKANELMVFRNTILSLIANDKRCEATELIVSRIMEDHHIYTLRHDEKAEMWIYDDGIYIPQGKTFIKEVCRAVLSEAFTTYTANQVIAKIETDTYVGEDEFFNHTYLNEIPVENGILNIKTKELWPFDPEKIFFNKIPITYEPNKDCPKIIQHLSEVLKNKEDLPVMQELFGYLLLKESRYEKSFMFLGTGRNGKGKTVELMKRFLGPENCANIPIQKFETDPYSISELHNKMVNLGADIDNTSLDKTGTFKSLTGRDTISAQRKFLPMIHFTNYSKMVFCANELPRTHDQTDAFWDRWILLEFPYKFVKREDFDSTPEKDRQNLKIMDPEIIEKISDPDEMSGLLNWALEGLHNLSHQKGFSYSKNTAEIKEMWLRKSDSFSAFMMDCLEECYGSQIQKPHLRHLYTLYCRRHRIKMMGDRTIKNGLIFNFGVFESRERVKGDGDSLNDIYYWEGIKWKDGTFEAVSGFDENIIAQGDQGDQGFSTLYEILNFSIGSKKGSHPSHPSHIDDKNGNSDFSKTKEELVIDLPVSVFAQYSKNVMEFLTEKNRKIDEIIKTCFPKNEQHSDKIIAHLKENGEIAEIKPGLFTVLN
jgi:P4 family phage/plasmid primase-like protien